MWRVSEESSGGAGATVGEETCFRALKVMEIPAPAPVPSSSSSAATQLVDSKIIPDFASEINILQRFSSATSVSSSSAHNGHVLQLLASEVVAHADGSKTVYMLQEQGGFCLHSLMPSLPKSPAASSSSAAAAAAAPLSLRALRRTFRSLCLCVAKVHEAGVAHLDIKPGNFVELTATSCASSCATSGTSSSSSAASAKLTREALAKAKAALHRGEARFGLVDFGIARVVEPQPSQPPPSSDQAQGSFNCQCSHTHTPAARPRMRARVGLLIACKGHEAQCLLHCACVVSVFFVSSQTCRPSASPLLCHLILQTSGRWA